MSSKKRKRTILLGLTVLVLVFTAIFGGGYVKAAKVTEMAKNYVQSDVDSYLTAFVASGASIDSEEGTITGLLSDAQKNSMSQSISDNITRELITSLMKEDNSTGAMLSNLEMNIASTVDSQAANINAGGTVLSDAQIRTLKGTLTVCVEDSLADFFANKGYSSTVSENIYNQANQNIDDLEETMANLMAQTTALNSDITVLSKKYANATYNSDTSTLQAKTVTLSTSLDELAEQYMSLYNAVNALEQAQKEKDTVNNQVSENHKNITEIHNTITTQGHDIITIGTKLTEVITNNNEKFYNIDQTDAKQTADISNNKQSIQELAKTVANNSNFATEKIVKNQNAIALLNEFLSGQSFEYVNENGETVTATTLKEYIDFHDSVLQAEINALDAKLGRETDALLREINRNKDLTDQQKEDLEALIANIKAASSASDEAGAQALAAAQADLTNYINGLDSAQKDALSKMTDDMNATINEKIASLQKQINELDAKLGREADALLKQINKNKDLTDQQKADLETLIGNVKAASEASDEAGAQALADAQADLTAYINGLDSAQKKALTKLTGDMNATINEKIASLQSQINALDAKLGSEADALMKEIKKNKNLTDKQKSDLEALVSQVKAASEAGDANGAEQLSEAQANLTAYIDSLDNAQKSSLEKMTKDINTTINERIASLQSQINALDAKLGSEADALLTEIQNNKKLTDKQKSDLEKLVNDVKTASEAGDANGAEQLTAAQKSLTDYIDTLDGRQKKELTNLSSTLNATINEKIASLQSQINALDAKLGSEADALLKEIQNNKKLTDKQKTDLETLINNVKTASESGDADAAKNLTNAQKDLTAYINKLDGAQKTSLTNATTNINKTISEKVASLQSQIDALDAKLGSETDALLKQIQNNKKLTDKQKTDLETLINNVKTASESGDADAAKNLTNAQKDLTAYIDKLDGAQKTSLTNATTNMNKTINDKVASLNTQISNLKTQTATDIAKAKTDANSYTDTQAAKAKSDATSAAKTYTDTQATKAKTDATSAAKTYTDTQASKAKTDATSAAKTYTDSQASKAKTDANSYTDTQISNKLVTMANQAAYDSLVSTGKGKDASGKAITYDSTAYYFILAN